MLTQKERESLLQNSLFKGFSEDTLDRLLERLAVRTVTMPKNTVLWSMGERVSCAGIVLSGRVEAWRYTADGQASFSAAHEAGCLFGDVLMSARTVGSPVELRTAKPSKILFFSLDALLSCIAQDGGMDCAGLLSNLLEEISEKAPRAGINGLVYLKDVDTAKELLVGKTVYIQAESVRIDDANNYSGYRDIAIPVNTEATITAIGVGSQAYPAKIVFKDTQGHSYYLEVALSRTNSGMDLNDFQGEKRMKYFSNAFSFTNKSLGTIESLKNKYMGMTVYPKKVLPAKRIVSFEDKQTESRVHLPRYTVLQIKDIRLSPPGSLAILSLEDKDGAIYELETDLKYDVIVRNENYIEDFFGFEDIHKKYPGITENRWQIISRGDLETGMSTVECRLSIGDPIEIELKKDNRFETWFYNGKTLEFENGTLQRYK